MLKENDLFKGKNVYKIVAIIFGALILGEYLFIFFHQKAPSHTQQNPDDWEKGVVVLNAKIVGYKPFLIAQIDENKAKSLIKRKPCILGIQKTNVGIALIIDKSKCSIQQVYQWLVDNNISTTAEIMLELPTIFTQNNTNYSIAKSDIAVQDAPFFDVGENVSVRIVFYALSEEVRYISDATIIPSLKRFVGTAKIIGLKEQNCAYMITTENASDNLTIDNSTDEIKQKIKELFDENNISVSINLQNNKLVISSKNMFSPDLIHSLDSSVLRNVSLEQCLYKYNIKVFVNRTKRWLPSYLILTNPHPINTTVNVSYYAYNLPKINAINSVSLLNTTN